MGVRLVRSFFVLLWVVYFLVIRGCVYATTNTICAVGGCNCTVNLNRWKNINCSLQNEQEIALQPPWIPPELSEIFIVGGQRIVLHPKSFSGLPGLNLVQIEGARNLVVEKRAFHDLKNSILIIRIQNCDHLSIKTGAFENVQSSIEIEIKQCGVVEMEKAVFNKLTTAYFKDIGKFILAEGTFEFLVRAFKHHGPVTTITIDNATIPTLPRHVFFSTLAQLKIRNSRIKEIQSEAFYANTISSLSITHSKIDYIHSEAFVHRLIVRSFELNDCTLLKVETGAVKANFDNFTVQHSRITEIQTGAINSSVMPFVDISANEIANIQPLSFVVQSWNKINFEQNIIKFLHKNFLVAPVYSGTEEFSFIDNDIYNLEQGALSFVTDLKDHVFLYKNNFFNQTCHCTIDEWIVGLISRNITNKIKQIRNNTFCTMNNLLSKCLELPEGVMNIQNFTELVCNTNNNITIMCEPYRGETKIINTTSILLTETDIPKATNWLTIIISVASILMVLVVVSFIAIVIRGSRWLKRKGYFRKIQYNQNEHSNDEENTIETVDESDKIDISEDLTMDLLQDLSKKLDDPNTHQEASEMIEQLYQKYIRNNAIENNNQEEEAHLYEELSNLQQNGTDNDANKQQTGPRSILRLMEEKFNTQFEDIDAVGDRPALNVDYSEPTDAAIHLYSELRQNKDTESENNKDSIKSKGSSNMAFRPLPDKPGSSKM